jgi:hypothetical protein
VERLREDVEALAAMRRGSATGEAATAAWIAERLAQIGVEADIRPYRGRTTYAWSYAVLALAGRLRSLPLRLAALVALELDASGRLPLPLGSAQGANVVARIPASGDRCRTLVLVAHHDTQRSGLVWHPAVHEPGAARRLRTRSIPPYLPVAGLIVLLGRRRLSLLLAGLAVEQGRNPAVPGANDNATGVAALLALVERHAADPLDGVEVVAAAVGGEESGMQGMRAFLDAERLDPATTLVISLDTLGSGRPIVLRREHTVLAHDYAPRDLELVPPEIERWSIGGWTDALQAKLRGLRALSILSIGPKGLFTHYHHPSDTPDHVDFGSVEACVEIAAEVCERWARRSSTVRRSAASTDPGV